jgi:NapC/NirT cytochrome c family, N-terminal region
VTTRVSRAALLRHPVAIGGALITTASAVVFVTLAIGLSAGLFERNPYAGLVVFVAIPAVFVLGLLLIPFGMWLEERRRRLRPEETTDWPVFDFRLARVRRTALAITALTAVNIVIILLAGYGSLHWMESPQFCGQVCHTPMHPQFTAWSAAIHARVACVDCHIGEGAGAFVHAKLAGVRQLVHVATNRVPQPIPPGAEMPPGAQARTCGGCHPPGRMPGDLIHTSREYADDEANSETATTLVMHVGGGASSPRAIHWHADPAVHIEYVATDAERQTIPYVKVTDAKGQVKEYRAPDTTDQAIATGTRRTMDCIDCHNTVGHPIAATPEQAVDRAIAAVPESRKLPLARREGIRLVKESYPSQDEALRAIDRELRKFYESREGTADGAALARTISAVQEAYQRNVFPAMKVTFGTYPDNRGHVTSNGCFRCHDDSHEAKDGSKISGDCEYCHKQLEQPF